MSEEKMKNKQDAPLASEKAAHTGKKAYRKPSVQFYGTLAQVTNASPNTMLQNIDSPSTPANTHRT
jgi:hypothetical protein